MQYNYDIIIFGGGVAGLFVASRLARAGYNLILIEKDKLGAGQTLASQGMIHGGQKYALAGGVSGHARSVAEMPARWDACFEGRDDVDLSAVRFLSGAQVMFPAGSLLSTLSVFAAAKAVNGRTRKMTRTEFPSVLRRGAVYEMQEKVLDGKSLVAALAENLRGRLLRGDLQELSPEGQVTVSGVPLRAQAIIFTAGTGNETALRLLQAGEKQTQRRPLRQVMVKPMESALFGHGVVGNPKPRVTITSHPLPEGGYVWYLGGDVAEKGAAMSETDALHFAKKEMMEIFPHINWAPKEWASRLCDRAEPFDAEGRLPPGPCIRQYGRVMVSWPTKLTFAPALADRLLEQLAKAGITPSPQTAAPDLPVAETGSYPWEEAAWQRL